MTIKESIKIDLHIHTNNSDGELSSEDIFKIAQKNNIKVISITDHDYIDTYEHLDKKYNILTIPGIEFNTSYKKLHILGYGIKNIEYLKKYIDDLTRNNEDICLKVIDKLNKENFDIDIQKIKTFCKQNNLKYSYLNKKLIVKYLIYKRYANTVKEAYDKLIGRNAPFYYPIIKLEPKEVINLINKVDGISVLAHPSTIDEKRNEITEELIKYGLNGIEIVNLSCPINERNNYEEVALKNNLITTYGSDFHDKSQKIGVEVCSEKAKKLIKNLGGNLC